MTPEIKTFMPTANGGRRRAFTIDGVKVFVEPTEDDERGRAVAEFLGSAHDVIEALRAEVAKLRAVVPPKAAARLLGPAVVRMRGGDVWILNRADGGWAEFGFRAGSWDDIFRRFDVRVVGHGRDSHGEFWSVEPCAAAVGGAR